MIPSPNLDDRDFETLMVQARDLVSSRATSWTDFSPGDPGVVLLELFAYLTDILIYRVNRLPEKAHIELLRLLDFPLRPPTAAIAGVTVSASDPAAPIELGPGTELVATAEGSDSLVFLTDEAIRLTEARPEVTVTARHCRQITAELLGRSNGRAGQRFSLAHAPVIQGTGNDRDLLIAVEVDPAEVVDRDRTIDHQGRSFEIWPVVESFAATGQEARVVLVDRQTGGVTFAPGLAAGDGSPAPLAAVPPEGREVRAWYRCGGGEAGNVAAGTITRFGSNGPDGSVAAVNREPAIGGRDGETVAAALDRARFLFHEPRRAITADDFEALAVRHGAVARAEAATAAGRWVHAAPGTVVVNLVPTDPVVLADAGGPAGADAASGRVLADVRSDIEDRQPLGVTTTVQWARFKPVTISLTAVVSASEDLEAIRTRVERRLDELLDPLPSDRGEGWPFGRALRVSNVFDAVLREPGVRYVEDVRLAVDDAPDSDVRTVVADHHQPSTWYASSGGTVFRSTDDGRGWEPVWNHPEGEVVKVVPAGDRPGQVAVVVLVPPSGEDTDRPTRSAVHVSDDCGSSFSGEVALSLTWGAGEEPNTINDLTWLPAGHDDDLLVATDRALYRVRLSERTPIPVAGAPEGDGFWSVAVIAHSSTDVSVVAGLKGEAGVVVGASGAFGPPTLTGFDIRSLTVEDRGTRRFVWAAVSVEGDTEGGVGAYRAELLQPGAPLTWSPISQNWSGGSCRRIDVGPAGAVAASEFNGVLRRPDGPDDDPWQGPDVDCGLPLRPNRRFERIWSVALGERAIMAATNQGLFISRDGRRYEPGATRESTEFVTLPPSWLFRSGHHRIDVRTDR